MEKLILLLVGFVAFTGVTDGAGLLPDNMTAAEGGTVMFTTVSPPDGTFIVISWLFGAKGIIIATPGSNTPTPDYEGRVTIFFDTGSLELQNLALNDSGEYTVRITTAAGEHTGTTTLKVIERISNPSITPTTNVAIEGNNFNLTCDAAAGSMLTRKWLKDGSDLTLSDNITLHDDNRVLSFQPLNRANNGEYTCNISNPISTMEAKYTLPVNYGADNVQIKGESKINSGDTFTLTCSAESEPSASFTWTLNGTVVHNSAEYKKKAEPSDSGNYTCQAENSITGRSSSAMHGLTVIGVSDGGLSAGAISGIVIACLIVVAAAAAGGYVLYKKNGGKPQPKASELPPRQEPTYQNSHPAQVKTYPVYVNEVVHKNPDKEYDTALEKPEGEYDTVFGNPEGEYNIVFGNPEGEYDIFLENSDLVYQNVNPQRAHRN